MFVLLVGCGGGSGTSADGAAGTSGEAGTSGSAGATGSAGTTGTAGTTGAAGSTGAAGTTGVAGTTGAAGTGSAIAPAPAGEHFCACDLTEAGAWGFGKQKVCRVSWAKTGTLTTQQKAGLDYGCEAPYCKLTTSCPRSAPDVVGLCVGYDSPAATTRTYVFVEKANITPDAMAFAIDAPAICGSPAYDLAGNTVMPKCTGTGKATYDGTVTEFSTNLVCWYKSDGVKSQYFVQAQDATKTKSFNLTILQEAGAYSVPGNALAPGFSFIIGNSPFAFPKDADHIPVTVTKFMPAGAGLTATFSPGEVYSQPGGKGAGPHTITDGTIDIKITP